MLTSDLVRLRVRSGKVFPGWIKVSAEKLASAAQILAMVAEHAGSTRAELDAALDEAIGHGSDFRILRGLARLVLQKTEIDTQADLVPSEVRTQVFAEAAAKHPLSSSQRVEALEAVAARMDTTPEAIEASMFADLKSNQRVGPCPDWTADGLLHRYNLALAQAVLLRTKALRIELDAPDPRRLRQLLRFLKFHRLMFEAEQIAGGWRFVVDGPTTLVSGASRYGMSLAKFLPALLLCERWRLEADYQAKKASRTSVFELDPSKGLVSHLRDTGTWVAAEEQALVARLSELAQGWEVDAGGHLVDLDGRGHLVPDVVLRDPSTGAEALVEIAWRWRKQAIERRWDLLRAAGPKNLVLCLCTAPKEQRDLELPGAVHTFRGVPNAKTVWKLARQIAAPPKTR